MIFVKSLSGTPHWATFVPFLFLGTSFGNSIYSWIFIKAESDVHEGRLLIFLFFLLFSHVALASIIWNISEGELKLSFYMAATSLFFLGFIFGYMGEVSKVIGQKEEKNNNENSI